jgi:hypothetical protein
MLGVVPGHIEAIGVEDARSFVVHVVVPADRLRRREGGHPRICRTAWPAGNVVQDVLVDGRLVPT